MNNKVLTDKLYREACREYERYQTRPKGYKKLTHEYHSEIRIGQWGKPPNIIMKFLNKYILGVEWQDVSDVIPPELIKKGQYPLFIIGKIKGGFIPLPSNMENL
jgi:hypothetical protein